VKFRHIETNNQQSAIFSEQVRDGDCKGSADCEIGRAEARFGLLAYPSAGGTAGSAERNPTRGIICADTVLNQDFKERFELLNANRVGYKLPK
jgi:hypothetical protein